MINGKKYSWEDISTRMPHGMLLGIQDIEYNDGKEIEAVYGKGSNPIGYGSGNYSSDGKMTVLKEEHDEFVEYAKRRGRTLYGVEPFPIVVSYANEDQPTKTDVLKQCKITKVSHSSSQNDKQVTVEYEFKILGGVNRDGLRPN